MINLVYGGENDKDEDKEEIPFDCIPHETQYLTHGDEVEIKKTYNEKIVSPSGQILTFKIPFPCPNWEQEVQNYTNKGYTITFEGETMITMRAPN